MLSAFYVRASCVGVRVSDVDDMWHDGAYGGIGHSDQTHKRRIVDRVEGCCISYIAAAYPIILCL